MSDEDIRTRLAQIIREFFDEPDVDLNDATTAADVRGWDSLAHIQLIVVVEKAFNVRFRAAEVQSLRNFGEFVQLITSRRKPA